MDTTRSPRAFNLFASAFLTFRQSQTHSSSSSSSLFSCAFLPKEIDLHTLTQSLKLYTSTIASRDRFHETHKLRVQNSLLYAVVPAAGLIFIGLGAYAWNLLDLTLEILATGFHRLRKRDLEWTSY
ncbi:PREDICTED: uncharacterized protein LOC101302352 [Fragaria vesca subsp. vesca]